MVKKIETEDQITELFKTRSEHISDSDRTNPSSEDVRNGLPRWYLDNSLFTRLLLFLATSGKSKTAISFGDVNRFTDTLAQKYGILFHSFSEMRQKSVDIGIEISGLMDTPKDFVFAEFPIGIREVGGHEVDGADAE